MPYRSAVTQMDATRRNGTQAMKAAKKGKKIDETPLLTNDQAAAKLDISPRKLQYMRADGIGPKHIRIGKRGVRYSVESIERYLGR